MGDLRKGERNSDETEIATEVLVELRRGNHGAYDEVYAHYQRPVCDFINALTRSQIFAEDITHDVFIAVWENREKLEPGLGIHRYLYTVARNRVMRYFRQKKAEGNYLGHVGQQTLEVLASDEIIFAKETYNLIRTAISRMPCIRGRIFTMHYFEGLNYEQIAERLEMNKATVANHLTNARNDIRKMLMLYALPLS